ncbi:VTC domain-containing protein [Magnetococcales bacterium HHB-1]
MSKSTPLFNPKKQEKITIENFARYEFKYLLSKPVRDLVEQEIVQFMNYDGYVHKELGNQYFVRSLYFDNDMATHYYEKIDGIRIRRKFRIRTYGKTFSPSMPIYLEEKGRSIDHTFKIRTAINYEHLPLFFDPDQHEKVVLLYPDTELIGRFFYDSVRKKIKPKVLVDYIRCPYTSPYDGKFRITLDSQLMATASNHLFPEEKDAFWRLSQAGYTIMEVKFQRRIPAWFHRMIQAYNLRRLSISKFCKGMEVCDIATELS